MEEALRLFNTNLLKMNKFNWSNLLSHPSEVVRVDELLRNKQIELDKFTHDLEGWTEVSAQEVLEHKRLVYRMRCYLHISANNFFNCRIMSTESYKNLKESNNFMNVPNFISRPEDSLSILTATTPDQFWLIMSTAFDRQNSLKFYRKIIASILGESYTREEKEIMIEIIIKNCDFRIEDEY
jgi:hypothetical protein